MMLRNNKSTSIDASQHRFICIYLSLALLPMLSCHLAAGATLHVAPKVVGPGSGGPAAPFASIHEAVAAANPDDTILIAQGSYRIEQTIWINKPGLRLCGISGQRPILVADGEMPSVITVVADRTVLQDLVIQGGFYGVKIDVDQATSTRGVMIRNCQIGSTGADCVKSYNADQLLIETSSIGPSGAVQPDNAEGIDIIGSLGVIIRGCRIEDTATNAIYLKGGTRNGLVERCLIRRAGHGGILLGQDTDASYMRGNVQHEAIDCLARNNIIVGTRSAGLGTYSGSNVRFLNNTLVDVADSMQAAFWVVTNSRRIPAEEVVFRNNIVVLGGDRPAMFVKDAAGLPRADFNIYHAPLGGARFVREISDEPSLGRTWTLGDLQRSAGIETHSAEADPQLDHRHFRPAAGGAAAGRGELANDVSEDYFGHRRSQHDIGAVAAAEPRVEGTPIR